jgi:hypothetical protein
MLQPVQPDAASHTNGISLIIAFTFSKRLEYYISSQE